MEIVIDWSERVNPVSWQYNLNNLPKGFDVECANQRLFALV